MKLCIRAHDLGANSVDTILNRLEELGADSAQLVCYKVLEDIPYVPGAITPEKAEAIGKAFAARGKGIDLVGAYFNPVHSDKEKTERCMAVFADYLRLCKTMGCQCVGSETGSFNDDSWSYNPKNRTQEGLEATVANFKRLREIADECGSTLAMEGAAGHVCYNVATLQKACQMVGGKTRVVFDLVNFLDADTQDYMPILEEGLETFGEDILMFHVKDCKLVPGQRPRIVPFGTGDVDWKACFAKIKAKLPNAVLTLEETANPYLDAAVKHLREIW